ncbi:TPA: hypothetical protein ACOFD8_002501 [Stenotrophomonas maltophilia]
MRVLITGAALVAGLLFASAEAAASSSPNPTFLYEEVSAPGESMDAFTLRIAPRALKHTNKSGHQVCGAIESPQNGQFRIKISTIRSGTSCQVPSSAAVYFTTHTWSNETFSQGEREIPGYLAVKNSLYYQNGMQERKVGTLGLW